MSDGKSMFIPSKLRMSCMMVGWIDSTGTGGDPALNTDVDLLRGSKHGSFQVLLYSAATRRVLPPSRSNSLKAGLLASIDSDLSIASCACRRNFWTIVCGRRGVTMM